MKSDTEIEAAFRGVVNMSAAELTAWLESAESKSVGFKREGATESIGHASGRRIVALLRARKQTRSPEDLAHMRKVVGYVRRHRAQRPYGDISCTRWRYSLMNWGHDPVKDDAI